MTNLREKIARTISETPVQRGEYSMVYSPCDEHYRMTDRILALPEIAEALKKAKRWDRACMDALDD